MSTDATALKTAQAQLLQLLALYEEAKEHLKEKEEGESELTKRLQEAEQDVRFMTSTMAQVQAENARLRQQAHISDAQRAAASTMMTAMVELRSSLRTMADATEEFLAHSAGGLTAPLPPGLKGDLKTTPDYGKTGADARGAMTAINEMVPFFPDTKAYLKKAETNDRSAPNLDGIAADRSAGGVEEGMPLVPLYDSAAGVASPEQEKTSPKSPATTTQSLAERRKQLVALRKDVGVKQFDM